MNKHNWKRTFFTIWAGQAVSLLSSAILQFAILWYLADTTSSGLVLSLAGLAGFLPHGLLGPFIGVLVDRYDRKKIMIIADLAIAATSMILVVVGLSGPIPLWVVMVVLFLRSIGTAFHAPCIPAVTPLIVPEENLTKCAGYSQTLESVSLILSPVLAGLLYAKWSLPFIILLDVLGAAAAIIALLMVRIPKLETTHQTQRPHVLRESLEGFQVLRAHKGILWLVLLSSFYFFSLSPAMTLYPLMSMSYFGGTTTHASIAEVCFSVGMMAGSLILGAWGGTKNKIVTITASIFLMGLAMTLSGLLPPSGFVLFSVYSAMMGFSVPFYSGVFMALLQQRIEPAFLGRVISLSTSIMSLAGPVGLSVSGLLSEYIGVEKWFLFSGVLTLVAAVLCIAIEPIRRCDTQPPQA